LFQLLFDWDHDTGYRAAKSTHFASEQVAATKLSCAAGFSLENPANKKNPAMSGNIAGVMQQKKAWGGPFSFREPIVLGGSGR
jgi:hypothetical protein